MDFFPVDNLSSVEVQVEVGALLSTTFEKDDSADVLFWAVPESWGDPRPQESINVPEY